ncbi:hypothetical protein F4803DRAFT_557458 [Xylaria telfairii]|nr:hypothetical protein F4803DRAFT_557458 [Xylaria telfairii]
MPTMTRTRVSTIIKRNAQFASQNRQAGQGQNIVCVFAGAMSGIGARILERMLMVSYQSTVFYVLWQSSEPCSVHRKMVLESILNRGCKLVFIDADASLISDMDTASQQIIGAEEKVDYLCMSKNDILLNKLTPDTSEGVEMDMSIWYFSRMRLLYNLLPLLRRSLRPRVLNILNDGFRGSTPKDYSGYGTILQRTTVLNSLIFNYLATQNPKITFILSPMGLEVTEKSDDGDKPENMGVFLKAWRSILETRRDIFVQLFGRKPDRALERHIYYLTSAICGPGPFVVDKDHEIMCLTQPSGPILESDENRPDIVWEYTDKQWEMALAHTETNSISIEITPVEP